MPPTPSTYAGSGPLNLLLRKNTRPSALTTTRSTACCFKFSQDLGERVKAVGDTNRISKSLSKDGPQPQPKRSFPFLGSCPGQRSGWSKTRSLQLQSRSQLQHPYQPPQRSTARGRGNQRLQYGRAGPQQQRRE